MALTGTQPFGSDELGRAAYNGDAHAGSPGFAAMRDSAIHDLSLAVNLLRGMGHALVTSGERYQRAEQTVLDGIAPLHGQTLPAPHDSGPAAPFTVYRPPAAAGNLPTSTPPPSLWMRALWLLQSVGIGCAWPDGDGDGLERLRDTARAMRAVIGPVADDVAQHAGRVAGSGSGPATHAFTRTARHVHGEHGVLFQLAGHCETLALHCQRSADAVRASQRQCIASALFVILLAASASTLGAWAQGLALTFIRLEGMALRVALRVIREAALGAAFSGGLDTIGRLARDEGFDPRRLLNAMAQGGIAGGLMGGAHAAIPALGMRSPALTTLAGWLQSPGPAGMAGRFVVGGGIGTAAIATTGWVSGHGWDWRHAAETGFGMALVGLGAEGSARAGMRLVEKSDGRPGGANGPRSALDDAARRTALAETAPERRAAEPAPTPPAKAEPTAAPARVHERTGQAGESLPHADAQIRRMSRFGHDDLTGRRPGEIRRILTEESSASGGHAQAPRPGAGEAVRDARRGDNALSELTKRLSQIDPRAQHWLGDRYMEALSKQELRSALTERVERIEKVFRLGPSEQPFRGMTLELTGRGNEQIVYTPREYPDVVLKIRHLELTERLAEVRAEHLADPGMLQRLRDDAGYQTESLARRLSTMRSVYGEGHSVPVQCHGVEFPFPGRVLNELGVKNGFLPEERYTLSAHIAVQPKLDTARSLDLMTGFPPPRAERNLADVREIGNRWVDMTASSAFDAELLARARPRSSMVRLWQAWQHDPELAVSLGDFIIKTREYSETSRELLALRGSGNVVFQQQGRVWNYHLLDALGPSAHWLSLDKSVEWFRRVRDGEVLYGFDRNLATSTFDTYSMLNAIGMSLGVGPYFTLPKDLRPYPWERFVENGMM
ncbi:hypothetical protein GCM10022226_80830 [Sphaerisporangium flaviroseum]|uniref:Outer membrane channel protein CpnT-like N-terminal domain-containing protein n=1 Tax=Sphaerisporangium flaviroseum TaxID=509199 RepID=A0ABP7JHV6_9ACTN